MRLSVLLLAISLTFSTIATANPNNSNGEKFEFLHAEIMDLRDAVTDLSIDSATTNQSVEALKSDIEDLTEQLNDLQGQIEMLSRGVNTVETADVLLGVTLVAEYCGSLGNVCTFEELMNACAEDYGADAYLSTYGQYIRGFNKLELPDVWGVLGLMSTEDSFSLGEFQQSKYWVSYYNQPARDISRVNPSPILHAACAGPSST